MSRAKWHEWHLAKQIAPVCAGFKTKALCAFVNFSFIKSINKDSIRYDWVINSLGYIWHRTCIFWLWQIWLIQSRSITDESTCALFCLTMCVYIDSPLNRFLRLIHYGEMNVSIWYVEQLLHPYRSVQTVISGRMCFNCRLFKFTDNLSTFSASRLFIRTHTPTARTILLSHGTKNIQICSYWTTIRH